MRYARVSTFGLLQIDWPIAMLLQNDVIIKSILLANACSCYFPLAQEPLNGSLTDNMTCAPTGKGRDATEQSC